LFQSFYELERSYAAFKEAKIKTPEQEKQAELDVCYDVEKLQALI
jgi:hypothetical protein